MGGSVDVHLGDGTVEKAKVVAVYENGLGFGDVTLPHDVVVAHTTDHLDRWLLVHSDRGEPERGAEDIPYGERARRRGGHRRTDR
ncbi:hypothetical protein [Nonomuraea sp. NPDC003804]|uniref:hypothetical protein n=1 Tax=Nonomuraea sp. NPDC003804 TaxID=3154547 RepID=UPI00339F8667